MTVDVVTGEILPAVPGPARHDSFGILDNALRLAEVISNTELVPKGLRGRADAVVAIVLTGHELGLGPMQSLQTIDLIDGQPTLSPEGMRALVLANGHGIIVEPGDEVCTVRCHRKEWPPDQWAAFSFTIAEAERAELLGKPNWKKYPPDMLTARATGRACRATFSDVLAGVSYTPEERGAVIDATVAPPCEADAVLQRPDIGAEYDERTSARGPDTSPDPLEVPGAAELETKMNTEWSGANRVAFRGWLRSVGLTWPPTTAEELAAMTAEAGKIGLAVAEERETYEPDPPAAPREVRDSAPIGSPYD